MTALLLLRASSRAAIAAIRGLARVTLGLALVHDAFMAGVALGVQAADAEGWASIDPLTKAELRALAGIEPDSREVN